MVSRKELRGIQSHMSTWIKYGQRQGQWIWNYRTEYERRSIPPTMFYLFHRNFIRAYFMYNSQVRRYCCRNTRVYKRYEKTTQPLRPKHWWPRRDYTTSEWTLRLRKSQRETMRTTLMQTHTQYQTILIWKMKRSTTNHLQAILEESTIHRESMNWHQV